MARTVGSDGEKTAKAIQEKSLELFARHGYAAVSMRQIADAVGIQASGLYQYYKTKQQMLLDVMQRHMDELLAAWENSNCPADPTDALEHFTRFHISFHLTRPDAVFVSYMELRSLEEAEFDAIEALRKRYERILRDILRQGAAEKSFQIADPHVSAMAILAMITGVNTWYRSGGRLSQSKIRELYVAMVRGAVGLLPTQTPNSNDVQREVVHV